MSLLDNIFWHALSGPHAGYASGGANARRYARGFSPLLGFADPKYPDLDALAPFCDLGEKFYCADWAGAPPRGWQVDVESTMYRMTWAAPLPPADGDLQAMPLRPEHAAQAVELALLTRPGPFGPRTIELGEYYGCFEGSRLIAMAGERMHADGFREISGVCTHPEFQGRGLARRLMNKLIRRQVPRGELPILHVMHDNTGAHGLYLRMGFSDYRECVVRVISRCAS